MTAGVCFVRAALVRETPTVKIGRASGPSAVVVAFRAIWPADDPRETFVTLHLDTQSNVIAAAQITVGLLNSSLVHPREVFAPAILNRAASIILVHNHPSGDPEPSPEDIAVTRQLVEAGALLGIPVRDHVIVAGDRHISMRECGLIS